MGLDLYGTRSAYPFRALPTLAVGRAFISGVVTIAVGDIRHRSGPEGRAHPGRRHVARNAEGPDDDPAEEKAKEVDVAGPSMER